MPLVLLDDDDTIEVADSDLNLGEGFEPTDAVYTLRVITPQKHREITKRFTKKVPSGGRGMVEEYDQLAGFLAQYDYALKDWTGVVDKNGVRIDPELVVNSPIGTVKAKFRLDNRRQIRLVERASLNLSRSTEDIENSFRTAS